MERENEGGGEGVDACERRVTFPFSAMVGLEKAKLALLCVAVDPLIGGVLLKGDKGTGKSTLVRALASVLPEIEVVADCPLTVIQKIHLKCVIIAIRGTKKEKNYQ